MLTELIAHARENSPYYRQLYAGLPAAPDLAELPIVDHATYWAANSLHDNTLLSGEVTDGMVFKTGGTTSAPRVSVYTRAEWRDMVTTFATGLPAAGVRSGDRVANLFYAGELYSSFIFTLNLLQEAAVDTVQLPIAGSAPADFSVRAMKEFAATVVAAPPTSLCQLAQHVLDTVGVLPAVRVVLFSGESFYGDQRALLAAAFPNAVVRSIGYASVDGGALGAPVADSTDSRLHRAFRPSRILEIVDPETGAVVTAAGVAGRVVVTDLSRRLQPVIRYPVGDLAEWVDCDAGVFRLLGRSDEGARVGPVTVYLDDLRSVVEQVAGAVSGMQVVLRRVDAKDELVVRVVAAGGIDAGAIAARLADVRPMFADHVRRGLIQPLAVEAVRAGDLVTNPRTGKLIRLVDERG